MTSCCLKRSNLFEAYEPDEIIKREQKFRGRQKSAGPLQNGGTGAFAEIRAGWTTRVAGTEAEIGWTGGEERAERTSDGRVELAAGKFISGHRPGERAGQGRCADTAGCGVRERDCRSDELVSPGQQTICQSTRGKAKTSNAGASRIVARRGQTGEKRFERLRPANCAGQTGN